MGLYNEFLTHALSLLFCNQDFFKKEGVIPTKAINNQRKLFDDFTKNLHIVNNIIYSWVINLGRTPLTHPPLRLYDICHWHPSSSY